MQKDGNGMEKQIHYVNRALKKVETNYSVTDLDGTATLYCVKKCKNYILGNHLETTLVTDHKPLIEICNNMELSNNRHSKWVTLLTALKVKILFEEERKNVITDALSWMEERKEVEELDSKDNEVVLLSKERRFH